MALLNRKTIGLLVSAIALGGAVLIFETSQQNSQEQPGEASSGLALGDSEAEGEAIFAFEEEAVEWFSILRPVSQGEAAQGEATASERLETETLTFEKNETGTWQMIAPEQAEAEGGAIAFLLSQITGTASKTISVSPDQLEEFGLVEPEATVTVEADGRMYEFLLGVADFSGSQRYVQAIDLDKATANTSEKAEPESLKIHLLSDSIASAIERPTLEWLPTDNSEIEDASTEASTAEDAQPPAEDANTDKDPTEELPAVEESADGTTEEVPTADPQNSEASESSTQSEDAE